MKIIENIDGLIESKVEGLYVTLIIENAEVTLSFEQWERLWNKTNKMIGICKENQVPPRLSIERK